MSKKLNRYEFIWKAIQKHGYKYDYRKVNYVDCKTKVCIICPEHGEFWQTPDKHINSKQGCYKCRNIIISEKLKNNINDFIFKARNVHGNKYDYSKVKYVNNFTKVCIICPKHGEFWQTPNNHYKYGCYKCVGLNKTIEEFIKIAKEVHGNKYDYSKVKYKGAKEKVCIICPKHGEFWQTPDSHLNMKTGCPICNESVLEREVSKYLDDNNIKYERQKKFEWLKLKTNSQSLDFYLPDYNVSIECQGRQHFEPVKQFGGEKEFNKIVERDKRKYDLCINNGIKLLYYTKSNIINDVNYIPNNFIFNLNDLNL